MAARATLLVLLAGCCPISAPALRPLPRITARASSSERLGEVLERLRAEENRVQTMAIVHSIELRSSRSGRVGAFRGLIAVRRPDAYRLRLLGPAGLTALDLRYRGGRFVLSIPARGLRIDQSSPPSMLGGLPVEGLAVALLTRLEATPTALYEQGPWTVLYWHEPTGDDRLLYLDRDTGLARIESLGRGSHEHARLTYSDYRIVAGVPVPFQIELCSPREGLRARVAVERYTLNRALPERAFRLD